MHAPGLSVIVCCHNGASRLAPTLAHLARQRPPGGGGWELVLVDNASTDGTAELAARLWAELGAPAPYVPVREARPGLGHARRAGVAAAGHEFLLFCDDDNWLAPDYLARARDALAADAGLGAVGGCAQPVFEGRDEPPCWFWNHAGSFAVGAQGLRSGDATERGYLWGAGIALRGGLLRRLFDAGIEPLLAGRTGGRLLAGDDGEICKWYLLAGYRLAYDAGLRFRHFVPSGRQTPDYLERLSEGLRHADPYLSGYGAYLRRGAALRAALSLRPRALMALAANEARILLRGRPVRRNVRLVRRVARELPP